MTFFDSVEEAPQDPILGITVAYANDPRESKINLGVGAYKTHDLKPYLLPSVKEAEKRLLQSETNKEYLPIQGDALYLKEVKEMVVGIKPAAIVQTVGGTSALRIGGAFLKSLNFKDIYLPDPTWDNHKRIFAHAGLKVHAYPYYNREKKGFDGEAFFSALRNIPTGSALLLHACCHNPTGCDPTFEEWKKMCAMMKERELFPFFDSAYQGFGEGLKEDVKAISHFVNEGVETLIASSFSKNFGLYGERVGALIAPSVHAKAIESQLKVLIRGMYSNPPSHGARIVAEVLGNKELRTQWEQELQAMRQRIATMREELICALEKRGASYFSFMRTQKGMFSYTGLEEAKVEKLIRTFGIYMPKDGRINVAGLNSALIEPVVSALLAVQK